MSQPANDEFSQHLSDDEASNHEDASDTEEDSVGKPLYSRFIKTNDFKGVPHPLSGDYTPKPQEEIDESLLFFMVKWIPRACTRTNINSVRPNINTGRVNVNSVRPNVNTGRVNVNSVRPNVNTGRVNVNFVKSNVNTGGKNVNSVTL
ncbi:hypothetical protein Tco_0600923 [Tanacetum coccineum]